MGHTGVPDIVQHSSKRNTLIRYSQYFTFSITHFSQVYHQPWDRYIRKSGAVDHEYLGPGSILA